MSLYNMLFGTNPDSKTILEMLGLDAVSVGRFRDVWVADGEIAVYTRNGGGNRQCWHADDKVGSSLCEGHEEEREVKVFEKTEVAGGHMVLLSGPFKMEKQKVKICKEPDSEHCGCPGCIITYRLPKHPLYLRDADDDFDCTYATVYFKFPPQMEEALKQADLGEKVDMGKVWGEVIANLKR